MFDILLNLSIFTNYRAMVLEGLSLWYLLIERWPKWQVPFEGLPFLLLALSFFSFVGRIIAWGYEAQIWQRYNGRTLWIWKGHGFYTYKWSNMIYVAILKYLDIIGFRVLMSVLLMMEANLCPSLISCILESFFL